MSVDNVLRCAFGVLAVVVVVMYWAGNENTYGK